MASTILGDIKVALGLEEADTAFDLELLMHINSTLAVAYQVGGVPQSAVPEIDNTTLWVQIIADKPQINFVKSYIVTKVKIVWDPPQTSFALNALKEVTDQYEWRLREYQNLFVIA